MKRIVQWLKGREMQKVDFPDMQVKIEEPIINPRMAGYQSGLLGLEAWGNPYIGDYDAKNDFMSWQRGWCSGRQERSQKDE